MPNMLNDPDQMAVIRPPARPRNPQRMARVVSDWTRAFVVRVFCLIAVIVACACLIVAAKLCAWGAGTVLRALGAMLAMGLRPTVVAPNTHDVTRLLDEEGRLIVEVGVDEFTVVQPSGQLDQYRNLTGILLADGTLWSPLTRVPVGVCDECRHPRFHGLRREQPSHGIVSLQGARRCASCGRLCCPRHRKPVGRHWQCLTCASKSRIWGIIRSILFTREKQ